MTDAFNGLVVTGTKVIATGSALTNADFVAHEDPCSFTSRAGVCHRGSRFVVVTRVDGQAHPRLRGL
jgi:hypothetical protein